MKQDFVFFSESVTRGHPDKLCDQISDAIVDRFLEQDVSARVDAECALSKGVLFIAAHFASSVGVDVTEAARGVIRTAGYEQGVFNAEDCTILTSVSEVPPSDTRASADNGEGLRSALAEQQVTVFGYACQDTPALMPAPISLAHELARGLDRAREAGDLEGLSPDAKTQIAVQYENRKPSRVHSISVVASAEAHRSTRGEDLREAILEGVIGSVFEGRRLAPDQDTGIYVSTQPTFAAGGPSVHSGLTGRKTAVDTYGEYARHSGSALSGKDPLRIDRMGAYAARYAAKNVVAAGLASECEVQLSYSIGQARPVSLNVDAFGTSELDDAELTRRVDEAFDFRPGAILLDFGIRERFLGGVQSFFLPTATYGHMGREDLALPWEAADKVPDLLEGSS